MSPIARWGSVCAVSLGMTLVVPARAEPRKPTHVACVGDSITAGAGASATAKNYVSQLQTLLGNSVQVKNFGNSGSTMLSEGFGDKPYINQAEYTAATTFVSNAGAAAVVSVVIVLGANDSKAYNWDPAAGKNDQQYLKDYRAMVEHFAGLATKPVVYVAYPLATGTNPCCNIRGNVIHDEQRRVRRQRRTRHRYARAHGNGRGLQLRRAGLARGWLRWCAVGGFAVGAAAPRALTARAARSPRVTTDLPPTSTLRPTASRPG